MSCERYEDGLIDVALGLGGTADLEAHLSTCTRCRAWLEGERRLASIVDGMLGSALDVKPRPGFERRVEARIGARRTGFRARWALVAASATAVVCAAALVHRRPTPEKVPPRTAARPVGEATATSVPGSRAVEPMPEAAATTQRAPSHSRPPRLRATPGESEIVVEPGQEELLLRLVRGLRAARVTIPPPDMARLDATGVDPMRIEIPTAGRWEAPSGETPTQWPEWETADEAAGIQMAVRRPL